MALRPSSQKCSEGNCQNVEISKLKTSSSTTLENTNSKLYRNLHFATAKQTFYKTTLRKWIHFSANFETLKWQFRYSEKQIWQKKSETARAVSGPEGCFCFDMFSLHVKMYHNRPKDGQTCLAMELLPNPTYGGKNISKPFGKNMKRASLRVLCVSDGI